MNTFARQIVLAGALLLSLARLAAAADPHFKELRRFDCPEATQAVAVDATHFYAIGNSIIAKYDKRTGERVKVWRADETKPLSHLNSGVVIDGKLYCASSNFPKYPEASSIEIWDCETLEHVDTHSFGIYEGSLTWIDRRDGAWWACFAHYSEKVNDNPLAKDHRYTSFVRFDDEWRRTAGWMFPKSVLDRFKPHSSSGGVWADDKTFYCTGHDLGEVYAMKLPEAGPTLVHSKTLSAPITGQGIALDPARPSTLYGIDRAKRQVVVSELTE